MWGFISSKKSIVEGNFQTLTLGAIALLLYAKRYWTESITKMLWPYALKAFTETLNELKVDYGGITPMEKFTGKIIDITL